MLKKVKREANRMQMSKIVRTAANLLYPFVLTFGFYVIIHGHLTPGGGFQGGAVIATGTVLVIIAHEYSAVSKRITKEGMSIRESFGLLLFLVSALAALAVGGAFFANWLANSGILLFGNPVPAGPNPGDLLTGGVVPIMNVAVGLEVWGGLSLILLYMLSSVSRGES
ncbi:MAG: MnhB domain-containing protein [Methanomicrobiales archaeon]|nr:MnhB domain-containing protein [Methanomicrobiales archaeon]MDI6877186.1 MnhB domain-containing protein [Methanomicrobiales archaeon]